MSVLKVPKLDTELLHFKVPAPSKFTVPLAAVKVLSASYTPVVVIESVPSISVGPFAVKVPLLIDNVPSTSVVPVTVTSYWFKLNIVVAGELTTKSPATLNAGDELVS